MDQTENDNTSDQSSGYSKPRINPFYIEIEGNWTDYAKNVAEMNAELMVLCKTEDDFRKTQNWLDTNSKKYATPHPKNQHSKKFCMSPLLY